LPRDPAHRPVASGGSGLPPRLLAPREVARALGCSEWWVKEQARRRRIPFTKVGGAYRFTPEHLTEIIGIFEHRPTDTAATAVTTTPRRRTAAPHTPAPVVQLHARQPRRAQQAG
jgi:excisionase family DNA binding protein